MIRAKEVLKCTPAKLGKNDSLLTIVRKLPDSITGFRIQIELMEYLENPFEEKGIQDILEPKITFHRGWLSMNPDSWDKFFGYSGITTRDIGTILEFSNTLFGNEESEVPQLKNKHYLELNLLNPSIQVNGTEYHLHLKYIESLIQRDESQRVKKNKDGEVQTVEGHPIYISCSIETGRYEPVFFLSDQIQEDIKHKRLLISEEIMRMYNTSDVPELIQEQLKTLK